MTTNVITLRPGQAPPAQRRIIPIGVASTLPDLDTPDAQLRRVRMEAEHALLKLRVVAETYDKKDWAIRLVENLLADMKSYYGAKP